MGGRRRDIGRLLYPGQPAEPEPQFSGAVEGTVIRVVVAGIVFSVEGFPGQEFGPARWSKAIAATITGSASGGTAHTHPIASVVPAAGDKVLVMFVGTSIGRPWVVAWAAP